MEKVSIKVQRYSAGWRLPLNFFSHEIDPRFHFRGDEVDFGTFKNPGRTSVDSVPLGYKTPISTDPSYEDMLVANATVAGYVANRSTFPWLMFQKNTQDMSNLTQNYEATV